MTKKGKSSLTAIIKIDPNERKRFIGYAQRHNNNIKTYEEFEEAFMKEFNHGIGLNAMIDSDDLIILFESNEMKEIIQQNTTDKEFEALYGDGIIVKRESVTKKEIVTITSPKTKIRSYQTKKGVRLGYEKTKNRKFSGGEETFLKVRRQKKISTKQIVKEYQEHFKDNPRTESSIKSKIYRT